jgi:hypothetical protein
MVFGAICGLIVPFPMFWTLGSQDVTLIYIALTLGLVLGQRPVYAVQAKFDYQLFSTRLRYTGVAWPREIVQATVAGTLPFVATALVASNGDSYFSGRLTDDRPCARDADRPAGGAQPTVRK